MAQTKTATKKPAKQASTKPVAKAVEANDVPRKAQKQYVAQLDPRVGFDLAAFAIFLNACGLRTPVFTGRNQQGHFVDAEDNIVLPAFMEPHLRILEVQPDEDEGEEDTEAVEGEA